MNSIATIGDGVGQTTLPASEKRIDTNVDAAPEKVVDKLSQDKTISGSNSSVQSTSTFVHLDCSVRTICLLLIELSANNFYGNNTIRNTLQS